MDKKLSLKLNGGRTVAGILRGFDPFMNVVLDESVEHAKDGSKNQIGMVVRILLLDLEIQSCNTHLFILGDSWQQYYHGGGAGADLSSFYIPIVCIFFFGNKRILIQKSLVFVCRLILYLNKNIE